MVSDIIRIRVDEGISPNKENLNVVLGGMVNLRSRVKSKKIDN